MDNTWGSRDWKRALFLFYVVTSSPMRVTVWYIPPWNSCMRVYIYVYYLMMLCGLDSLVARSIANLCMGTQNVILSYHFHVLPCIKLYELFVHYQQENLDRAIGQCPWLPNMCFRSIHEHSEGSTRVCKLYQQPESYTD